MILSKSCEYAIRAAIYVAYKTVRGEKTGIIEISEVIGSPMHFTGKILQTLTRKKVLSSLKGPTGGFYIEDPSSVYLVDIIRAIDGDGIFKNCIMGLSNCSEARPCPMHHQAKPIRDQLCNEFSRKSVFEMVQSYEKNEYFLR
ncbi:MAG: RrF2 family transcriptional regulator [Arcticibacter sp.]